MSTIKTLTRSGLASEMAHWVSRQAIFPRASRQNREKPDDAQVKMDILVYNQTMMVVLSEQTPRILCC